MSDLRKKKKTTIWQSFGRCRSWASWPMPTGSGSSREAEGRGDKSSSLAGLPRTKGRAKLGPNVVILQPHPLLHRYLWPSTCPFRWEAISGMLIRWAEAARPGWGGVRRCRCCACGTKYYTAHHWPSTSPATPFKRSATRILSSFLPVSLLGLARKPFHDFRSLTGRQHNTARLLLPVN